jgi:hypothetical protein
MSYCAVREIGYALMGWLRMPAALDMIDEMGAEA